MGEVASAVMYFITGYALAWLVAEWGMARMRRKWEQDREHWAQLVEEMGAKGYGTMYIAATMRKWMVPKNTPPVV